MTVIVVPPHVAASLQLAQSRVAEWLLPVGTALLWS
jgi:hypothetical protein